MTCLPMKQPSTTASFRVNWVRATREGIRGNVRTGVGIERDVHGGGASISFMLVLQPYDDTYTHAQLTCGGLCITSTSVSSCHNTDRGEACKGEREHRADMNAV